VATLGGRGRLSPPNKTLA